MMPLMSKKSGIQPRSHAARVVYVLRGSTFRPAKGSLHSYSASQEVQQHVLPAGGVDVVPSRVVGVYGTVGRIVLGAIERVFVEARLLRDPVRVVFVVGAAQKELDVALVKKIHDERVAGVPFDKWIEATGVSTEQLQGGYWSLFVQPRTVVEQLLRE